MRYIVQAQYIDRWVDCRVCTSFGAAEAAQRELIGDNAAWMGEGERRTHIKIEGLTHPSVIGSFSAIITENEHGTRFFKTLGLERMSFFHTEERLLSDIHYAISKRSL